MNQATQTPIAIARITESGAMLMFGLSAKYQAPNNAGIPSQWNRFGPYMDQIQGQKGHIAYGVIYNSDDAGNFDYMCAVEVTEFPSSPPELTRLRIPPQTYAVFEHREHISSLQSTFHKIWNNGLAGSGYQAADGPALERYGESFDPRTGLGGLEIWVPIRK